MPLEDPDGKTEKSIRGFDVTLGDLGKRTRFPSELDTTKLRLDVGCGSKPSGDVNVDFFVRGWNSQEGDQKSGEFLNPKVIPNFVVADAGHLPFKDSVFAVVFSSHVIEHVPNPLLMLKEMCRVSKRKIVVRCPHRKGSGAKKLFHLHYLDEKWFQSVVTKLGFQCKPFIRAFDFPFTERIKLLTPRSWLKAVESSLAFRALRRFERSLQQRGKLKVPLELEVWVQKERTQVNFKKLFLLWCITIQQFIKTVSAQVPMSRMEMPSQYITTKMILYRTSLT